MARPKGKNRLKREYATAERAYHDLSSVLADLQGAQLVVPRDLLLPAIDVLYAKVDAAERVFRALLAECLARGIRTAYGHTINRYVLDHEAEGGDEDEDEDEDENAVGGDGTPPWVGRLG